MRALFAQPHTLGAVECFVLGKLGLGYRALDKHLQALSDQPVSGLVK